MGLEFEVSPACLIPRQDTELLVLKAYDAFCRICPDKKELRILDICTGSGCVIISLAHLIMQDLKNACGREHPVNISFEGTDISTEALEVAVRNASHHETAIRFHISDMFETLDCEGTAYDIITANPPYIETAAIKKLNPELWKYEPMLALDGGEDGLAPYRLIALQAASHLKPGGTLLMEIGDTQGRQVKTLMEEAGFENVTVHRDLAGLDRVVVCRKEI